VRAAELPADRRLDYCAGKPIVQINITYTYCFAFRLEYLCAGASPGLHVVPRLKQGTEATIMLPPLKLFLQRWLINTIAVLVAANIIPGIEHDTLPALLVASLLLGVLNALLRPLLLLLSLPLVIFTLGLFTLVINALLLMFVGQMVKSFHVETFWAAFWGALIISFVSLVLNTFSGTGEKRIDLRTRNPHRRRDDQDPRDSGGGPVIDV
jgi:putative membrane protein